MFKLSLDYHVLVTNYPYLNIRLGTPMLLGGLLRYFKKNTVETYEMALLYAGGICLATAINVISLNQAIFGAFHIGAKIRVAACSVVYRKVMRMAVKCKSCKVRGSLLLNLIVY